MVADFLHVTVSVFGFMLEHVVGMTDWNHVTVFLVGRDVWLPLFRIGLHALDVDRAKWAEVM